MLVNGLAIFFVLLFSVMAAFACTRMQWKLRSTVYLILLLGLMIPSYSALLPNFLVLEFTGQYSSDYAVQFATMALAAIPALIVYIAMNKSIVKGVAAGAIKG